MKTLLGKMTLVALLFVALIASVIACDVPQQNPDANDGNDRVTVTYVAGEGGQIEGVTVQTVDKGDDATGVTAVPLEGYRFVIWSDLHREMYRQDTQVTEDMTVTAIFERYHTVTYAAGEGGQIQGETVQTIGNGSNATGVTAIPLTGYKFVGWSDGYLQAYRQDTQIADDITVTATFELADQSYHILYVAGIGGSIIGNCSQNVTSIYQVESVQAVAQTGYVFVGWQLEDEIISTELQFTKDNLSQLKEITNIKAVFEEITLMIDYVVEEQDLNQELSYLDFEQAALLIPKKDGNYFCGWYWDEELTVPVDRDNLRTLREEYISYNGSIANITLYGIFAPYNQLEFTIGQNVDGYDFSGFIEQIGWFGARAYYGTGYVPTEDEYGQQVDPEHCVVYIITSFPDYSDDEQHVTSIDITDPYVEVYGLTLNSSVEEIEQILSNDGYQIEHLSWGIQAKKGKITISFSKNRISIDIEVTNDEGIIF